MIDLIKDIRCYCVFVCFFLQAEDGIRDLVRSRGLGDVYKRQVAIYSGPLTTCEVRDMYNSCTLTQPASHSAVDGTTTQFVVTNDCFDSSSLTYQWQLHTGTAVSYTHLTLPTSDLV